MKYQKTEGFLISVDHAQEILKRVKCQCKVNEDGCWVWNDCISASGRPAFFWRGLKSPHRVAWESHYLEPLKGRFLVAVECENNRCCNPRHNKAMKKNELMSFLARNGKMSSGVKHGFAVRKALAKRSNVTLNMQLARQVRARRKNGEPVKKLAEEFAVCETSIYSILKNETWPETSLISCSTLIGATQ